MRSWFKLLSRQNNGGGGGRRGEAVHDPLHKGLSQGTGTVVSSAQVHINQARSRLGGQVVLKGLVQGKRLWH